MPSWCIAIGLCWIHDVHWYCSLIISVLFLLHKVWYGCILLDKRLVNNKLIQTKKSLLGGNIWVEGAQEEKNRLDIFKKKIIIYWLCFSQSHKFVQFTPLWYLGAFSKKKKFHMVLQLLCVDKDNIFLY